MITLLCILSNTKYYVVLTFYWRVQNIYNYSTQKRINIFTLYILIETKMF